MNEYLANALRDPAEDWIPDLFYEDFHTAVQWKNFIRDRFPQGVSTILSKGTGWSTADYQALYIACWTYKPVVKGSYMLKIFDEDQSGVEKSFLKQKKSHKRWTSHLHGPTTDGIDASSGWKFLKSYHELLIQMEDANDGKYMFLKCEGHPSISWKHYKSYRHKKKHGVGLDVNEDLLTKASDEELHLGIKIRAAENYSADYRALVEYLFKIEGTKVLDKTGEIFNTRQVAAMLVNAARKSSKSNEVLKTWLKTRLLPFGISLDFKVGDSHFDGSDNNAISKVFETMADFSDQARNVFGHHMTDDRFLALLRKARLDIRSVSRKLLKDFINGRTMTVRYFEEVNVHPYDLDNALEKALRLLDLPKMDY
jgi:hypothetical protein